MRTLPTSPARGSALVEFALVLTLLLLLLGGTFELGRAFWYYEALTKATRDGARAFSVAPKATINSAGISKAKTTVVNAANAAGVTGFTASNVTVTCLNATYADSSCVDGTAPGGVRVEITGFTVAVGGLIPLIRPGGGSSTISVTLQPSTTMRYMF
jgi:Flp pilus assembly protein TadG